MKSKKLIVFVCRGNIVRSVVAEVLVKRILLLKNLNKEYEVTSRSIQGTTVDPEPVKHPNITYYKDLYQEVKPALDMYGIDLSNHISIPIDQKVAVDAAIIIAMDKINKNSLLKLFPNQKNKIYSFLELINKDEEVIDPEKTHGVEKQKQIITTINNTIIQGFAKLICLLSKQR